MTRKITEMNWVVITREQKCHFCEQTKLMLERLGITPTYLSTASEDIYQFLTANGLHTVPQVYLNGQRLGGYEDTKLYLEAVDANASDRR